MGDLIYDYSKCDTDPDRWADLIDEWECNMGRSLDFRELLLLVDDLARRVTGLERLAQSDQDEANRWAKWVAETGLSLAQMAGQGAEDAE